MEEIFVDIAFYAKGVCGASPCYDCDFSGLCSYISETHGISIKDLDLSEYE